MKFEDFYEEANQLKQSVKDAIFRFVPREGEKLPHDYDPGDLEAALNDLRIYVEPVSDRAECEGAPCPIYLRSSECSSKPTVNNDALPQIVSTDTALEHVVGQVVEEPEFAPPIILQASTSVIAVSGSSPMEAPFGGQNDEPAAQGPLANFRVIPSDIVRAVDHRGVLIDGRSVVQAKLYVYTGDAVKEETLTIPFSRVGDVVGFVKKQNLYAFCLNKSFASQIQIEFQRALFKVPETFAYVDHGWQLICGAEKFVHRDAPDIQGKILTDLSLPYDAALSPTDCYAIWKRSLQLYEGDGVMAVLSVFSFLSIAYKLFEEAGHAPSFALFIVGKTNSYKTAIAKVLFTQVEDDAHRDHPRRLDVDSRASMDIGLSGSGRDNTTLFDDFSPGNGAKRAKLEENLEALIRSVGDRSTRSRSNGSLEDKRGKGVHGTVVFTGELKGKGLSSSLRCLYVTVKARLVNTEALSWFQTDCTRYGSLLQHWIFYLSLKWNLVVDYIRKSFDQYRVEARKVLHTGRMADDIVILWILTDLLEDFFVGYCGADESHEIYSNLKNNMLTVVMESERVAYQQDPVVTFMRALATMLENRELKIKPERLLETDLQTYDGFEEGDFIFLLPTHPYAEVREWIRMGGGEFNLSEREILSALCRHDYAVSSPNGDSKSTLHARLLIGSEGRKVNFMKLKKSAIKEFAIAEPDFF